MYENFKLKSVNSETIQIVDSDFLLKYSDCSYEQLTVLWKEMGRGCYCDKMLKIINPSDYIDALNSCYKMDYDESFLPFICTAFGDIFAYVKNQKIGNYIVFLNLRYGTYLILPDNLDLLLNKIIFNESTLKGWFDLDNYSSIKEKVGETGFNECYGYFPALVMGGDGDFDTIKIVDTLTYIDTITQMIGKFECANKF